MKQIIVKFSIRIKKKVKEFINERLNFFFRDILNIIKYGKNAPLAAQLIMIDPRNIKYVLNPSFKRKYTGKVISGDWDKNIIELESFPKYEACKKRFIDNKSWEESGAYNFMEDKIVDKPGLDGCYSKEDIIRRYSQVDLVFKKILQEQRLKSRKEVNKRNFRESGGVFIHINRYGEPIFGGGGWHRLAISKIIGLKSIPCQVGVIHKQAILIWKQKFKAQL